MSFGREGLREVDGGTPEGWAQGHRQSFGEGPRGKTVLVKVLSRETHVSKRSAAPPRRMEAMMLLKAARATEDIPF